MENEKDGLQGEAGNAGDQKPIAKRRFQLSRTQMVVIAIGLLILFLTGPRTTFQSKPSHYVPIDPVCMSNGSLRPNEPVGTVQWYPCPGWAIPGADCGHIMYATAISYRFQMQT